MERLLIVGLSIASTFAAGLAVPREVVRAPSARRGLAAFVLVQTIVLPALALAIAHAWDLGWAGAGLALAAAAAAGPTGPVLAVVAGGDAAVATRLFVPTTLVGTAVAVAVTFGLEDTEVGRVALASGWVTAASLAPLALGLALRRHRPQRAVALARVASSASVVLLVLTIAVLTARHWWRAQAIDLALSAVLVVVSMLPALWVRARASALATAQVGGVRNLSLALLVLAGIGAPPRASVAVLAYGLTMYVVTGSLALWARRQAPREVPP
jgi:bile acid:Na+ symporter, BASS family